MTDDEIVAAYSEGDFTLPHREFVIDAGRKIIAAYQAELLAGVEMPEPCDLDTLAQYTNAGYDKDDLQQYAAAAAAQAREKALDEAIRVASITANLCLHPSEIAAAIEQLKVKP